MKIAAVLIIVPVLAFSCQKKSTEMPWDREATTLAVQDMLTDYHDAISERGLLSEFDYLDNSPDFFWVPPGFREPLDFDEVEASLKESAALYRQIEISWETLKVFPLARDIASYTGIVHGIWTDTTGAATTMRIIESGTVIHRANGWKLLNGQSRVLE